jgi:chorismate dehydratase
MKKALSPLYYGKKLVYTADGSITFYNMAFCEALHAKSVGAFTESLHKFVYASNILNLVRTKDVALLDICFGAGYNLAVTIEEVVKIEPRFKLHITAIDKDELLLSIIKGSYFLWPLKGFNVLRKLIDNKCFDDLSLDLYVMDVLHFLNVSNNLYDVIYFDPFSSKNNDSLWQPDVYRKLYQILHTGGVVVTYASSKSIRAGFQEAGFIVATFKKLQDSFMESSIFIKP